MSSPGDNLFVSLLLGSFALILLKPEEFKKSLGALCAGVEGFGNVKGQNESPEVVPLNNKDVVISSRESDFQTFVNSVNATIPTKEQLARISNSKDDNQGIGGFSSFGTDNKFSSYANVDFPEGSEAPVSPCAPSAPTWDSASLLPKSTGKGVKSFQFSAEQEDLLANQAWLTAPERIGINTTEGSLRNASQDLRGDPFIIKMDDVSPWNQSTIYPDLTRRALDGGIVLDPSYKRAFDKNLGMFR